MALDFDDQLMTEKLWFYTRQWSGKLLIKSGLSSVTEQDHRELSS